MRLGIDGLGEQRQEVCGRGVRNPFSEKTRRHGGAIFRLAFAGRKRFAENFPSSVSHFFWTIFAFEGRAGLLSLRM